MSTIASYLALLSHQYQTAPNLLAWMAAKLQVLVDIQNCADSMVSAFDLDAAQGSQLDVLGQLLGVSRMLPWNPSMGLSAILDDGTYRTLLKAAVFRNHWDGTVLSIEANWRGLIPGSQISIQDNLDMTITVHGANGLSSLMQDLITHGMMIPTPQGVSVNYIFSQTPYFGFDSVPVYLSGFDQGHWV